MKQKLGLVCTLVHEPRVLFLDEPTNGVDPVSRREFWAILGELRQRITVVVTTPSLDEAERCDRVALMEGGRILTVDTPQGLRDRVRAPVWEVEVDEPFRAAELLEQARSERASTIERRVLDLARELPEGCAWSGITAAALLDLTSAAWLDRLARWCRGVPVLVALSVDGRLAWQPEEPEDAAVRARFFAHQRTDKGFGPALGADAARYLALRLEAQGQRVFLERSDWRLGPPDGAGPWRGGRRRRGSRARGRHGGALPGAGGRRRRPARPGAAPPGQDLRRRCRGAA